MSGNGKPRGPLLGKRSRRLLVLLAIVLVAFEIVYAVAVNIVLRTGVLVRLANEASPDELHLEVEAPWSVWPGRIHAEKVELRFQDRNLQFFLHVEKAVVDIGLWKAPFKVLHLTRVRGENVRYHFRHKVESAKGLERRLAAYPKIAGFADLPLVTQPHTPPLSDEEYNLWTVELNDADVTVSELWFQEYRWRGQGRATGGFHLKPERDALTERCVMTMEDGVLSAGPYVVADHFAGRFAAQLDRHDPRQVSGEQIFGKISLETDLRGDVPNLDVTRLYLAKSDAEVLRGAGTLVLKTVFSHGAWSEGSEVRYETDGVAVRTGKATISGPAELRALITRGGEDSRVVFSSTISKATLGWKGAPDKLPDPTARAVHVRFGATSDLTKPLRWTSMSAQLKAAIPSLRWLAYPFEKPALFTGGSADATLSAEWAEGKLAQGEVDARIEKAAFELLDQPTEVSGHFEASGTYDTDSQRGQLQKLQLTLPEFGVSGESVPGGLHVRSERLHWQKLPPERVSSQLELRSETISALVAYIISSDLLRALAKAFVHLGKTRAVIQLEKTPSAFELVLPEAKSGDVEAFGQFRADRDVEHPCSRWYVQDGPLSVGVVQSGGETSVEPLVPATWWRERPATPRCAVNPPGTTAKSARPQRPPAAP